MPERQDTLQLQQHQQQQHQQRQEGVVVFAPPKHEKEDQSTAASHNKSAASLMGDVSSYEAEEPSETSSSAVLFPGVNTAHEGDAATRHKLRQLLQQGGQRPYFGAYKYTAEENENIRLCGMLEERYGSLFMNLLRFLLTEQMLEVLMRVAAWHALSHEQEDLCKDRRFSLFVQTTDPGQFVCLFVSFVLFLLACLLVRMIACLVRLFCFCLVFARFLSICPFTLFICLASWLAFCFSLFLFAVHANL